MMFPLKCKNLIKDFSHNLNITRMFGHQYNTFQPINQSIYLSVCVGGGGLMNVASFFQSGGARLEAEGPSGSYVCFFLKYEKRTFIFSKKKK